MKPALLEQHTATDKRTDDADLAALVTRGMQLREGTDSAAVARYAEAYESGITLPPIVVFADKDVPTADGDATWYLADGHHRVAAAKRAGLTTLPAIFKKGTKRDALLYAATANGQHGVPLTNDDKRRIVATILADADWRAMTDRALADMLHVSPHLVAKGRAALPADQQSTVRKGKDGRTLNTSNIGKRKPKAEPAPPPIVDQTKRTADVGSLAVVLGLTPRLQFHSDTATRIIAACLLNDQPGPVHRDNLVADTARPAASIDLALNDLAADHLLHQVEGGAHLPDEAHQTFAATLNHWRKGVTTTAHRTAVQPRLPAAEPEELTAEDVRDPEPPTLASLERALFVERLTTGKFSYRASDQTLLALALITGVEGGDDRYSSDHIQRASVKFAEAVAREIAHHLTERTAKVAQLPDLADLCTLFGIDYTGLRATAERGPKS